MNLLDKLADKYHTLIFDLAYKYLSRFYFNHRAQCYLFELELERYRKENPLSGLYKHVVEEKVKNTIKEALKDKWNR